MECRGFEFHPRQLNFIRKVTSLGVLCCFALLFVRPCLLLSSFLLHLSLTCIYMYIDNITITPLALQVL